MTTAAAPVDLLALFASVTPAELAASAALDAARTAATTAEFALATAKGVEAWERANGGPVHVAAAAARRRDCSDALATALRALDDAEDALLAVVVAAT